MKCEKIYSDRRSEKRTEHQMRKISNINVNIEFFVCYVFFLCVCVLFISVIAKRYGIKNEVKLFSFEPKARKMPGICILMHIWECRQKAEVILVRQNMYK